jgi:hypothetical protein
MRMKLAFLAALGTVVATAASAMPINNLAAVAADDATVQNVRLVCNSHGRCWSTGPRYVRRYVRPRYYSYAPGYYAPGYYAPGYYAPSYGYGPGITFGFGFGPRYW